jgi:hypothetical protein
MPTLSDWTIGTCFIFLAYMFQYVMTAGLFEYTHPDGAWSKTIPAEQRQQRLLQVSDELELGVWAMAANVFATLCWMQFVEPHVRTASSAPPTSVGVPGKGDSGRGYGSDRPGPAAGVDLRVL